MVWALEDAPVSAKLVGLLLGLANHADADGRSAYPTIDRLAHYARKKRRQTQSDLKELLDAKLIRLGDQRLVAHIDPRYRPIVYDLAIERRRPRYVRIKHAPEQEPAQKPAQEPKQTAAQASTTPSSDAADNTPDQPSGAIQHIQGCSPAHPGVQSTAPKPSLEPSVNPSPVPPPDEAAPATTSGGEDDQTIETVLRYQPRWRRTSVIAAIRQAIDDGMQPEVANKVMCDLAEGTKYGPTTAGPQRILAKGPWWQPGEVFVPAKREVPTCPKHPSEPAHNCACCAGERIAAATLREPVAQPASLNEDIAQKLVELSGNKYKFGPTRILVDTK